MTRLPHKLSGNILLVNNETVALDERLLFFGNAHRHPEKVGGVRYFSTI
jgi:hypothetical protein